MCLNSVLINPELNTTCEALRDSKQHHNQHTSNANYLSQQGQTSRRHMLTTDVLRSPLSYHHNALSCTLDYFKPCRATAKNWSSSTSPTSYETSQAGAHSPPISKIKQLQFSEWPLMFEDVRLVGFGYMLSGASFCGCLASGLPTLPP